MSVHVSAFTTHDWPAEYTLFAESDQRAPLAPEDLERWAVAAHLIGEDEQVIFLRDRAHREYLEPRPGSAGSALRLLDRVPPRQCRKGSSSRRLAGETSAHPGEIDEDDPTWALEWLATAVRATQAGDAETAIPLFDQVSDRCSQTNDEDLLVLAGLGRGNCLIMLGDMAGAFDSLDESMLLRHRRGRRSSSRRAGLLFGDFGLHGALRSAASGGVDPSSGRLV